MKLKSKLPSIGTTIFTIMSSYANEYKAINLGQGFPDYSIDEELLECVNRAMRNGFNQYTHMNGYPLLREKVAAKANELYNSSITDDDITITPGATYALFTCISAIVNEGDEVIIFEPAYDCYRPAIQLNGGHAISIQINEDFSIPWENVKQKINNKTKAILINTPHNPTGYVFTENDINELAKITRDTDIIIISDEVYEHLIFDNKKHLSVLANQELYERSFACFSFGKTYNCTGWKIGYVIAPKNLMKEFRSIHQFNAFCVDTPKQVAIAEYIDNKSAYLNLSKEMQFKRDYFRKLMAETIFEVIPSSGSYFECYTYQNYSEMNDKEFAIELVQNYGVATIPMSAFYSNQEHSNRLRFCFAKKLETLEFAVERLIKLK